MKNIIIAIRFLLILLFVYAAVSKLIDLKGFTSDLNNQPFPDSWTPVLSWMIPLIEIAVATCLFFESIVTAALLGSCILMVGFTIYTLLVLLHMFRYVPCSCGGLISKLSWKAHLILNIFYLLISVAGFLIKKNDQHNDIKNFHAWNRGSRKPVKKSRYKPNKL